MSTTFADLKLSEPLQRALAEKNYTTPSPIQAQSIPHLLEGKDLLGIAQTGTGKTAAFALPILNHLSEQQKRTVVKSPLVLILTPTRELASQIGESFRSYGKHLNISHSVVFGGVGQYPQVKALLKGLHVLIATPGRLLDLHDQGHIRFDQVEVFVLDEADRMLDMGFIHDVKRILKFLPQKRQSLLFSATMPQEIAGLADSLLRNPIKVEVTPKVTTAERIVQKVCFVDHSKKRDLVHHLIKETAGDGLTLIFTKTKHGANRLADQLHKEGVPSDAIHGNKSQSARERALENFRKGRVKVLVATDIAARGIDVKGISLVVNYDLPNEPESYVHRIGRTARAGAEGIAYTLCDAEDRKLLRDVERFIRQTIPVMLEQPYHCEAASKSTAQPSAAGSSRGRNQSSSRSRSGGVGYQPRQGGFHKRFEGQTKQGRGSRHNFGSRDVSVE
ncbi:MAG: DEAD/DEAH box helicase [Blastochloris sp.]|nr:DEAD/DEAH box helicase [Blastochloris sp.]